MKTLVIGSVSALALIGTPVLAQSADTQGDVQTEQLNDLQLQKVNNWEFETTTEYRKVAQAQANVEMTSTSVPKPDPFAEDFPPTVLHSGANPELKEGQYVERSTLAMSSSEHEGHANQTVETGVGGPYYASEADVARDAELSMNVVDVAIAEPQFSTFASLIAGTDLAEELMEVNAVTVFAPTNAAFEALDEATFASIANDPAELEAVLRAHVVEGVYLADDIPADGIELRTAGDSAINIERDNDGGISAGSVAVSSADIMASNGVIHIIDNVIIPEEDTAPLIQ
ncbi:fasciclin domain-containing protein [Ponticaulis sp.]|uniref:fasciclin domain-containing protein n=1 Tax=Ponticaulis sp. TaxID=2020902 RepID=UPI000B6FB441|nr:fasciclin domain-containing protein [Ponticaulis sp.]MAI90288.1 hypothetical protein [Ponticaulis sp.]OUX99930.1 MAG: hypothetical protein CBB65_07590 [Hyphomonadaceae bacterium TMED5]|tara:strand:- start:266969 stop:267826 length:858 start_codon:yes stop_codon:yes gene_type:complete